jgi:hypothetical protein
VIKRLTVDADARVEPEASANPDDPSSSRSRAPTRQSVGQEVLSDWRRGAAMSSQLDARSSAAPPSAPVVVNPLRERERVDDQAEAAAHRLLSTAAAINRTRRDRKQRSSSKQTRN